MTREAGRESLVGKVVFADQLRGLAALLVVLSHLFNIYPFAQEVVSATAAVPPILVAAPWINVLTAPAWIRLGPFGVGVFFLVSGFVIPFSLRRHGRAAFLLARGLRIYPTYWAALAIGCGTVWASARYWDRPLPFDARGLLGNATLTHTWRHIPSIDKVNWTLVIELHFYLFAAALRPLILRGSLWPMLAAAAGAGALLLTQWAGWIGRPSFLELIAMSLPFMLIGTLFHYHLTGALRTPGLVLSAAGLFAVFAGLFHASTATDGDPVTAASYAYALLLFAAGYAARRRVPDWRALRWLARVSYPLYAAHLLAGFTLMTFLVAGPPGWTPGWASAATLAALLALAWGLHMGVEQHTVRWGAALGRREPPRPAAAGMQPATAPRAAT